MHVPTHGQWWSKISTQLSQYAQCCRESGAHSEFDVHQIVEARVLCVGRVSIFVGVAVAFGMRTRAYVTQLGERRLKSVPLTFARGGLST